MAMHGETDISHTHGSDIATVETGDSSMIDTIRKLHDSKPDKALILREFSNGSILAQVPFAWIKIDAE